MPRRPCAFFISVTTRSKLPHHSFAGGNRKRKSEDEREDTANDNNRGQQEQQEQQEQQQEPVEKIKSKSTLQGAIPIDLIDRIHINRHILFPSHPLVHGGSDDVAFVACCSRWPSGGATVAGWSEMIPV
jgi:hypothetical protein